VRRPENACPPPDYYRPPEVRTGLRSGGLAVLAKTAGAVLGVRGGAPQDPLVRRGEAFGAAEPGTKFRRVL
jgi:hypothetical protein